MKYALIKSRMMYAGKFFDTTSLCPKMTDDLGSINVELRAAARTVNPNFSASTPFYSRQYSDGTIELTAGHGFSAMYKEAS